MLSVRLDSSALRPPSAPQPPSYPVETGAAAHPPLGALTYVGSRRALCGAPEDPMELLSSVWATEDGGRFYTLDYGGRVRKRLYDLDGDGVIERESWDPDGDGRFDTTRRTRLPVPGFLVPVPAEPTPPDTLAGDSAPAPAPAPALGLESASRPDSTARPDSSSLIRRPEGAARSDSTRPVPRPDTLPPDTGGVGT